VLPFTSPWDVGDQFTIHTRLLARAEMEARHTCRRYLKTVDLNKNGLAVPVVDELATIPLDLWAKSMVT
jgi:formate dehydrogenase maturation protein FdhE